MGVIDAEIMVKWNKSVEDVITYKEWEEDGKRFTELTKRPGEARLSIWRWPAAAARSWRG